MNERMTKRNTDGQAIMMDCEDTGMAPEEIKAPLTEDAMINLAAQALGVEPSRLRELAEADKDRRVIVQPCKVGDKLYRVLAGEIFERRVGGMKSELSATTSGSQPGRTRRWVQHRRARCEDLQWMETEPPQAWLRPRLAYAGRTDTVF